MNPRSVCFRIVASLALVLPPIAVAADAPPAKGTVTPPATVPPAGAPATTSPAPVGSSAPGAPLKPGEKLRMKTVTLHVFHRVFRNFHDQVEATLKHEFRIGDSEYTGMITEFVPDFAMGLQSRKVMTRSQEPNNPAFHIIVRKNGAPVDTTWAFLDMPPHFTRRALVAFIATQVTFENHATVTSRDSLALKLMQSGTK